MARAYRIGIVCDREGWTWSTWQEAQSAASGRVPRAADGEADPDAFRALQRAADGAARVVAALPTRKVLVRIERFPSTASGDLAAMVDLRADAVSPFPADQMVHGWEILDRGEDETLVLLAVCREEEVRACVGPIRDGCGPLARVDVEAMGLWYMLQADGQLAVQGREVVLVAGEGALDLLVHDGGQLLAVSSIGSDGVASDAFAADIAWEVLHILRTLTLEFGAAPATLSLWGGHAALAAVLKERTGLPLKVSSLSVLAAPAVQAICRRDAMQPHALDLVPRAWRADEQRARFRKQLVHGVLAVLAVWLILVGGLCGWRIWRETRVGKLAAEHALRAAPAGEVLQIRKRLGMIRRYMDRRDSSLETLLEVVAAMPPEGVELLSFTYRKGDIVILEGVADNGQLRLSFMEALNRAALFKRVVSGQISIVKNRERFKLELFFTEVQP